MSWEHDLLDCAELVDSERSRRKIHKQRVFLTEEQKQHIRTSQRASGELCKAYNISYSTLARVRKNPYYRKLTDEQVAEIRRIGTSMSGAQVAKMFGVSRNHIYNIRNGVKR
jgi:transcriptional regulator with XRE-family HTH domain